MSKVVIEDHGSLAVMRLNNGVTNSISPALVEDLLVAVKQMEDRFHGVVLTGGEKFLSLGFDLPELLKLDRGKLINALEEVLSDLLNLDLDINNDGQVGDGKEG